jgi:mannitol-specific phosphotransferase system IIBC component
LKNVKQQISYFSYVLNNKTLVIPRFGVFSPWGYFSRVFLGSPYFPKIKGISFILYYTRV